MGGYPIPFRHFVTVMYILCICLATSIKNLTWISKSMLSIGLPIKLRNRLHWLLTIEVPCAFSKLAISSKIDTLTLCRYWQCITICSAFSMEKNSHFSHIMLCFGSFLFKNLSDFSSLALNTNLVKVWHCLIISGATFAICHHINALPGDRTLFNMFFN